jgi:hypothetical protein
LTAILHKPKKAERETNGTAIVQTTNEKNFFIHEYYNILMEIKTHTKTYKKKHFIFSKGSIVFIHGYKSS